MDEETFCPKCGRIVIPIIDSTPLEGIIQPSWQCPMCWFLWTEGPSTAMPTTDRQLPIPCPKCQHVGGLLVVRGTTVMTVTCDQCHHTWTTDLLSLPPEVQALLPIRDGD